MKLTYEVVLYGTVSTGEERLQVIKRVGKLLRLTNEQTLDLFSEPDGVVLMTTPQKEKAQKLASALVEAGASSNLRDAQAKSNSWEAWKLEDQVTDSTNTFECRACNYSEDLEENEPLPTICPKCGVVQSKYEVVAEKKLERERIKRRILSVHEAKNKAAEEDQERRREEALRKEIEKEILEELQLELGRKSKIKSISTAAATFVVGAVTTFAYITYIKGHEEPYEPIADQRPASTQAETKPANDRTLLMANGLVKQLDASTLEGTSMPFPESSKTIQTTGMSLSGSPLPRTDTTAQPALRSHQTVPQIARFIPESDEASSLHRSSAQLEILADWFEGLEQDPTLQLHLEQVVRDHVSINQLDTANKIAKLANSPALRVKLKTQILYAASRAKEHPATTDKIIELKSAINKLPTLEDKAAALLALAPLDRKDNSRKKKDIELNALFLNKTAGTLDRLRAEGLIAAARAVRGDIDNSNQWFQAANDTLVVIEDPGEKLSALTRLALYYYDANDVRTAHRLLKLTQKGLQSLGSYKPAENLADELILAFTTVGLIDEAVQATRLFSKSTLQVDLHLARLAVSAALRGRMVSAKGIISIINSRAQRARTKAQVSLIALYAEQTDLASSLAQESRQDGLDLPSPLNQVVASELARVTGGQKTAQLPMLKLDESPNGPDAAKEIIDQAKAIIAVNLAWADDSQASKELTESIELPEVRQKTEHWLQRINPLVSLKHPRNLKKNDDIKIPLS